MKKQDIESEILNRVLEVGLEKWLEFENIWRK